MLHPSLHDHYSHFICSKLFLIGQMEPTFGHPPVRENLLHVGFITTTMRSAAIISPQPYGVCFPFRFDRTIMTSLVPMYRLTSIPASR